jgi:two-component system KDP operon response regulator KdpE
VTTRVLVVDDDTTLLRFLGEYLTREGYEVFSADRGPAALRAHFQHQPDVIVLDVMMPGMDGWEVCARVREIADTPIILLTAKTSEADKLRGFRLGVDDYITKPFSLPELEARLRAILGRSKPTGTQTPDVLRSGELSIDLRKREVKLGGRSVGLTATEFRLLAALAEHPGQAIARSELIARVWSPDRSGGEGALRRFVSRLRHKLGESPDDPQRVITVRGFGYRLDL